MKCEGLYITDKTKDQAWDRGVGILKWIAEHNVENYIMLDDEVFEYKECGIISRLVKTSYYGDNGGLQDEHVELAISLLNGEYNIF